MRRSSHGGTVQPAAGGDLSATRETYGDDGDDFLAVLVGERDDVLVVPLAHPGGQGLAVLAEDGFPLVSARTLGRCGGHVFERCSVVSSGCGCGGGDGSLEEGADGVDGGCEGVGDPGDRVPAESVADRGENGVA